MAGAGGRRVERFAIAVLAAAALLITGCRELLPLGTADVRPANRTSLQPLFDANALPIPGTDTADVIAALGEPSDAATSRPPKRQRPGSVTTLRYDGLEVVVRELKRPQRSFISDLVITSGTYVTSLPAEVGASRADIEGVLGEPAEVEGSEAVYLLNDDGDRCVVVYDGDRATRVTFRFS